MYIVQEVCVLLKAVFHTTSSAYIKQGISVVPKDTGLYSELNTSGMSFMNKLNKVGSPMCLSTAVRSPSRVVYDMDY